MNIKVNQKMVKERCGIVSFKKGEAFYRASKVEFEKYSGDRCEAIVTGAEDFSVMVEKDLFGDFHTTCSCPTLASFQKDCQHVAAVLLAICEHQRQGTTPAGSNEHQTDLFTNKKLTEGLLTLFGNQPTRPSGHQLHFEKRQVLDAEFTCRLAAIGEGQQMFGIEVKVGSTYVQNIREFLEQVKGGRSCPLSSTFTYDSNLHCFQKETDAVIQQLIQVIHDEKMYRGEQLEHSRDNTRNQMLLIPASSWERLMPLLMEVPMLLTYEGSTFEGFCLSEGLLPLQFDVAETEGEDYQLKIRGLENLIVLDSYSSVLFDGTLVRLKKEDCQRLSNLKKMLEASGMDQVLVPPKQLDSFFKNVMPGLKRLGHVQLSSAVSKLFMKTPLTAKVYLDRVKNRLLAGLEFHYGNIVIDPLDSRESQKGLMVIRDIEKENAIIKLFDESLFTRTDGGYFLQNEELEYQFLYHVVPKLQKLVQLYATTAVRNRIFRGNSRPQIRVKAGKERTNWLEFKFELDGIPEKQICEILLALEEKRKYYRLPNGSLFSLETRELEEIHHFLNMLPNQPEDLHSGLHVPIVQGLPLLDSVDNSKLFLFEESFRQFLEVLHNPGSLEFEVPKSLEPILRDYQRQGYKWMKTLANYGFGGILADDMGMGKTLQSITFIVSVLPDIRKRKLPVLIVCPSSLTYNWLSELAKFAPHLQAVIMDGNQTERLKKQKDVTAMDVIIISYPLLRREIKWFEKQTFHTVFFDEAQAFKNSVTQTARAVKKIMADHRFALTGTPVENSSEELWSIFHVVFP
ncbi:MAG TPA: SNF2 helicase associated domain-containing protein, partial [Chondromyces sp.]|nr:SNF2 helicase associated domain-containing protein [Chondromyces sp.]